MRVASNGTRLAAAAASAGVATFAAAAQPRQIRSTGSRVLYDGLAVDLDDLNARAPRACAEACKPRRRCRIQALIVAPISGARAARLHEPHGSLASQSGRRAGGHPHGRAARHLRAGQTTHPAVPEHRRAGDLDLHQLARRSTGRDRVRDHRAAGAGARGSARHAVAERLREPGQLLPEPAVRRRHRHAGDDARSHQPHEPAAAAAARRAGAADIAGRRRRQRPEQHAVVVLRAAAARHARARSTTTAGGSKNCSAAAIESIPGVSNVRINFGSDEELQIVFDPTRAAELGIQIPRMAQVAGSADDVSGGFVDIGRRQYTVRFAGRYSVEQFSRPGASSGATAGRCAWAMSPRCR